MKLTKLNQDILAKTKVLEEATVRKAGGKYKMLPLFDETTAKIKEVRQFCRACVKIRLN
jgi:obg-like ATPase 1